MENESTRRIRFTLHYDGADFYGWQLQSRERTVQGEVERVLSRLLDRPVRIVGAGRTDRGVHATGQVAAVDAPLRWEPAELRRAMNALLPRDVWVSDAELAPARFHPRYDATSRAYIYRVGTVEEASSPFHTRWCWSLARDLDLQLLQRASLPVQGDRSFRAFAKAGQEERGDRCIVQEAVWREWPPLGLEFRISANRFLHHMVRYLVGTLVDIGSGRRALEDMESLLEPDTTLETSPPAPAQGLFLTRVTYPSDRPARVAERGLPTGVASN